MIAKNVSRRIATRRCCSSSGRCFRRFEASLTHGRRGPGSAIARPVYREAIHQRLGARLTPEQCRELAALLDLAVAESDITLPEKPSR